MIKQEIVNKKISITSDLNKKTYKIPIKYRISENASKIKLNINPKVQNSIIKCQSSSTNESVTKTEREDKFKSNNSKYVSNKSILVIGGTGTLGRQVVRKALDAGYDVRCIVRPRQTPADFLRDWGASTVSGDLLNPSSLPSALVGIHTIIDCATARPEESTEKIDWEGKMALIQCAQAVEVQRYIFFSIINCEKYTEVPLMNIKYCTEEFLKESGLNYTIFKLSGFMQSVIGNYAVPILEENQVWGTDDDTSTAYLDSEDVALMTMAALRNEKAINKTLTLVGPNSYTTDEVIALCEKKAKTEAKVTKVPMIAIKLLRNILNSLQWTKDAADRLSFVDLLSSKYEVNVDMTENYKLLDIDPASITTLESYLDEYYEKILEKLKEVAATSRQTDFYL